MLFRSGPAPAPPPAASRKLGTRLLPPVPPPIMAPAIVRGMYGTAEYVPAAYGPGRNRFGIVGRRRPSWDDLTDFMVTFQAQSAGATFTYQNVDRAAAYPSRTSNVAIQYASAMAYPTPLIFYGTIIDEVSLVRFLSLLLAEPVVIQTLSISYNYFLETLIPPELADLVCDQLARLGGRGSSVLVASGNSGVGDGTCQDRDGNVKFVPEFPSSCACRFIAPSKHYTRVSTSRSSAHVSQVPGSPALVALNTSMKSLRATPGVAFQHTIPAPSTRKAQ